MPINNPNLPANHQDAGDVPPTTEDFGQTSPPPVIGKSPEASGTPEVPQVQRTGESPVTKGKIMNFYESLRMMAMGIKVTKLSWEDQNCYGVVKDAFLQIFTPEDGQFHSWVISEGDIIGMDYIALPFEEAEKAANI